MTWEGDNLNHLLVGWWLTTYPEFMFLYTKCNAMKISYLNLLNKCLVAECKIKSSLQIEPNYKVTTSSTILTTQ